MEKNFQNIPDEFFDIIKVDNIKQSAVVLAPPKVPLSCFPGIIKSLLSYLFKEEWDLLNQEGRDYLSWITVKAESIDAIDADGSQKSTKGFEMLAYDINGNSFGGIMEIAENLPSLTGEKELTQ